jgi:hypothetical protein
LQFFADQAALVEPAAFKAWLAALRKVEWVVYAKRPFGGPDAVLAYLSRYTQTYRSFLPLPCSTPDDHSVAVVTQPSS